MHENPEKKRKSLHRALVAGAAMLAGVSATSAEEQKNTERTPAIERTELLSAEAKIENNEVPLKEQIRFLEAALGDGGSYARELNSIRLAFPRLSQIYKITNAVSARLTNAYSERPDDPDLQEYFSTVEMLKQATFPMRIPKAGGTERCNKYLVRDGTQAFEVTAFHCVKDSVYEKQYFNPDGTEIAVMRRPDKDLTAGNEAAFNAIPALNTDTTPGNINGRVVTAFSWGPKGEAKIHFSVAMPMPARRSFIFSEKEMHDMTARGVTDMQVFFKPFGEGQRNPETGRANFHGSSGGPVFASGYGILGNYSATKVVPDTCINVCYAMSFFSSPYTLNLAIEGERVRRNEPKK